jgi:hypothetical protein
MDSGRDCVAFGEVGKLTVLGQGHGNFMLAVAHGCQEFGVGAVKEDILHCECEKVDISQGLSRIQDYRFRSDEEIELVALINAHRGSVQFQTERGPNFQWYS